MTRKDKFTRHPNYAGALMREGDARQRLARLGVDSIDNIKKAIELYETARKEGLVENTPDYAGALMDEGIARQRLAGLGVDPIDNLKKAIELYETARKEGLVKNTPNYAGALMDEGLAREKLAGFGFDSIDNLKKAIELYETARKEGLVKNTLNYVLTLMNEGNASQKLADFGVNSIDNLKKAIELYETARKEGLVKNTLNYALTLLDEGDVRQRLAGLGIESISNLNKAIELYETARKEGLVKNTPDYAGALMDEGNARQRLAGLGVERISNLNTAELTYTEAKGIFKKANHIINIINVNRNLGYLNYLNNKMKEAYQCLGEAIQLIEGMRTSMKIPELRKKYFETVVYTYKTMVFTCLALHKDKDAFRYAESSKGRSFLEFLANEKKKLKGKPELIEKYQGVLKKIENVEATATHMSGAEKKVEEEELLKLKRLYDSLLQEIKQGDLEYFDVKTVEPINIDELSMIINGRTLVEYFLGDKIGIFVVNGINLSVKIVEMDEKELLKKVTEFRKLVNNLENFLMQYERAEQILSEFYELLIEPIRQHLTKEIIIIPHSYLHQIPFQALKKDRYLIEDYKISFAQSASSIKFLKKGAGNGALVVGNPTKDRKHSEDEAIKIAELLYTKPILRDDATKDKIIKEIKNKKILHFACHGEFDSSNPAFSKLILSDGNMTALDFMDIEMNANLTVLSACNTALSEIIRGDEVEGLVRAIQYSGSRFVIASLWKVEDESTKELFLNFYTKKENVVEGLREAELDLIKDHEFYYWAPFQVYGI